MVDFPFESESRAHPFDAAFQDTSVFEPVSSVACEPTQKPRPPLPAGLDLGTYKEVSVALDPDQSAFWCAMRPRGVPCFSNNMLRELSEVGRTVRNLIHAKNSLAAPPVKFFVGCSDVPGVFNLGGDLGLFIRSIGSHDRETLLSYAYSCVETTYNMVTGFGTPVMTIGVVEGDALGGGLEGALSFNVIIVERGAKMGFPEALFNSFPGMGAYSLLSRKLGHLAANKLILSGKIFLAEELHEMGIIDILAEPGQGREAARKFIAENSRKHALLGAVRKVATVINPITLHELRGITEIWVDTALSLGSSDIRKIEVLYAAQVRRLGRSQLSSPAN